MPAQYIGSPYRARCDGDGMRGANRNLGRSQGENLQRCSPPESAEARGATGFAECPILTHTSTDGLNPMLHRTCPPLAALAFTLLVTLASFGQARSAETAPASSLKFGNVTYHFAWRSEPSPDYVKYEYLPRNEELPYYHNMLMLERLTNGMSVADVVRSQVEFLNQRKESDPLVNHRIINNERSGEYLLDFVLSGETEDGEIIVEWNAYRYSPWRSANGKQHGVLLYGYSTRAYGDDDGRKFLTDLRETRAPIIQALASASVPSVP